MPGREATDMTTALQPGNWVTGEVSLGSSHSVLGAACCGTYERVAAVNYVSFLVQLGASPEPVSGALNNVIQELQRAVIHVEGVATCPGEGWVRFKWRTVVDASLDDAQSTSHSKAGRRQKSICMMKDSS